MSGMLFYGGKGEMAVSGTSSMVGVMGCRRIKQVVLCGQA